MQGVTISQFSPLSTTLCSMQGFDPVIKVTLKTLFGCVEPTASDFKDACQAIHRHVDNVDGATLSYNSVEYVAQNGNTYDSREALIEAEALEHAESDLSVLTYDIRYKRVASEEHWTRKVYATWSEVVQHAFDCAEFEPAGIFEDDVMERIAAVRAYRAHIQSQIPT